MLYRLGSQALPHPQGSHTGTPEQQGRKRGTGGLCWDKTLSGLLCRKPRSLILSRKDVPQPPKAPQSHSEQAPYLKPLFDHSQEILFKTGLLGTACGLVPSAEAWLCLSPVPVGSLAASPVQLEFNCSMSTQAAARSNPASLNLAEHWMNHSGWRRPPTPLSPAVSPAPVPGSPLNHVPRYPPALWTPLGMATPPLP